MHICISSIKGSIQPKNKRAHYCLGILQSKMYDQPNDYQKDPYTLRLPPKQGHHNVNFKKPSSFQNNKSFTLFIVKSMSNLLRKVVNELQNFLQIVILSVTRRRGCKLGNMSHTPYLGDPFWGNIFKFFILKKSFVSFF